MSTKDYAADAPVATREGDRLRRWPFAERIADTLAKRSDPTSLVVGVYGRWGEGKTTVLEFIEQKLAEYPDVIVIRFNPWLFTNDADLFVAFFAQMAAAIDRKLETKKEQLGEVLKKYGGLVSWAAGDLRTAGEELARVSPTVLRERLERGLADAEKRVVVLLDDIDRLDRNELQAVFRLLKVAADFRSTSYVLAFDREIVAEALADRYPSRENGGDDFLEKIVQVPLPLPPAPPEVLRKMLFADITDVLKDSSVELNEGDVRRFVNAFDPALMERVETVRAAKRYVNALQFSLPLLRNEVNTVDLLLVEGIRVFHPRLHAAIVKNRDVLLEGSRNKTREELEAFKTAFPLSAHAPRRDVHLLQELFPRAQSIFGNTHHQEEWDVRWAREKRIASDRYFHRYFSSGVPAGDIADETVRALLNSAQSNVDHAVSELTALIMDTDADLLVQKLFDVAAKAEGATALQIARVFAKVGAIFPNPPVAFAEFMAPRGRIAVLTSMLLRWVTAPKHTALAEILKESALSFATQVFRRLQPAETKDEADGLPPALNEAEWAELGKALLLRIEEEAKTAWFLGRDHEEGQFYVSLWREFGDHDELKSYVATEVAKDPQRALDVVRSCCSSARNFSGETFQEPLRSDDYERLRSLVDPARLVEPLTQFFGRPGAPTDEPKRYVRSDSELAHSFLRLHAASEPANEGTVAPAAEASS